MNKKVLRKLLKPRKLNINKFAENEKMRNEIVKVKISILSFLLGALIISLALSQVPNYAIVKNSGRIIVPIKCMFDSEVRGMFVYYESMGHSPDWELIAQTCAEYGINTLVVEVLGIGTACYYSDICINRYGDQLTPALQAAHSWGLKLYVLMAVLPSLKPAEDPSHAELLMVDDNGNPSDTWACPTNPKTRERLLAIVEELLTKFPDIDGFMFDFIRYPEDHTGWCYCEHCKAAFQEWLGENITDWTPFKRGGSRQLEYLEWRTNPVTEVVKSMSQKLRELKPDIAIGAAVWTYFGDAPSYWRRYLGQDTGRWIKEGYLDFVSPMIYTSDVADFEGMLLDNLEYMVDGPEGKIPIIPFIDVTRKNTPETFAEEIQIMRSHGVDGWICWAYGGPGEGSGAPDVRNYLSLIDMPETFSLGEIKVEVEGTQAIITWMTTLPTTSIVEYSVNPLFNASWEIWNGFHYWRINHIQGTIIEDTNNVTMHMITITNLLPNTKYYFRVQSRGSQATLTSVTLTFTTKS